jgi:hypothetical protein
MSKFRLFGGGKDLDTLEQSRTWAQAVNAAEADTHRLSDNGLRQTIRALRQRHQNGESLDALLPETFAIVREAAVRALGERPYDEQLIGAAALKARTELAEAVVHDALAASATRESQLGDEVAPRFRARRALRARSSAASSRFQAESRAEDRLGAFLPRSCDEPTRHIPSRDLDPHGSEGSAVLHDDQLEYSHVAGQGTGETAGPYGGSEPDNQAARVVPPSEIRGNPKPADAFIASHLRQYEDVVEAMKSGRPPAVTVQDGLVALALVHAVYVSAALRRRVEISALLAGDYDDVVLSTNEAEAR